MQGKKKKKKKPGNSAEIYFTSLGFIGRELRNNLLDVSGSDRSSHRSADY